MLLEALFSGSLEFRGMLLRVDLLSLFATDAHYLARAKKALMIALHLDIMSTVEFQVSSSTRSFHLDYLEFLPIDLFLTHFAPILKGAPRHV